MGMRTVIDNCNIDIVDLEGLKQFLQDMKDSKYESYNFISPNGKIEKNYGPTYSGVVNISEDGKTCDFYEMSDWKLISYWYTMDVQFLRDVAIFIEGDISLEFENNDEAGHISFSDGKCEIRTGVMTWNDHTPEILREDIQPMPKDLQQRFCARKI